MDKINEEIMISKIWDGIISSGDKVLKDLDEIAQDAINYSEQKLIKYLQDNKDTEYGRKYNFAAINSYDDYKANVPVSVFSDYLSLVDSITDFGKENVLTASPIKMLTMTNGTSGKAKYIPVTQEAMEIDNLFSISAIMSKVNTGLIKRGKKGHPKGKGIFMVERTSLGKSKGGIPMGTMSSLSISDSDDYLQLITTSPNEVICPSGYLDSKYIHLLFGLKSKDICYISTAYLTPVAGMFECMENRWMDLCDDIEKGTIHEDVEMPEETRKSLLLKLAPDPVRANELRSIFAQGFDKPIVPLIWPGLSYITGIGTGNFKIHTKRIRQFIGDDIIIYNNIISASESIMALATDCETDNFLLLPQAAFFEFIPEDTKDINDIKTFKDLEIGKRYEVLLTTLSGLYRYRIFDVFEVVDFYGEIPVVKFSFRSNVYINIAGEKTTEDDIQRAMDSFSNKTGLNITEYAAMADYSVTPGRYHILIETKTKIDKNKLTEYENILNDCFRLNMGYKLEQDLKSILPIKLSIQQPQTHMLYRELQIMKGHSINQLKPVRVLNKDETKEFFLKMIEE